MTHTPLRHSAAATAPANAEHQAFLLLRTVFTVAPILFGLDKFLGLLTDWDKYLAPWINDLVPGDARTAMLMVGVVEIIAGVVVALRPEWGGYLVAGWLAGIIVNLLTLGDYYDVALRDFGLFVAALALARLAASPAAGAARRGAASGMSNADAARDAG